MIVRDDLTSIGTIFKPHGIKGELSAVFDCGIMPEDVRCIVLDIDGIYVPFFIESSRVRGVESVLIKIEGLDNEKVAGTLANHEIFALTSELPADEFEDSEGFYLYSLEGYTLYDNGILIGTIDEVDDSTDNILLHVEAIDSTDILVPFAEEFITAINSKQKTIEMMLPEGIIDLNK